MPCAPVLQVCRDTAEQRGERWGGVDRSVRPGRKNAAWTGLTRSPPALACR